jgi:hypothetical protein
MYQSIRKEISDVIEGRIDIDESPLKGAPHTMDMVSIYLSIYLSNNISYDNIFLSIYLCIYLSIYQ